MKRQSGQVSTSWKEGVGFLGCCFAPGSPDTNQLAKAAAKAGSVNGFTPLLDTSHHMYHHTFSSAQC